jgi:hypothetical protein
MKKVVIAPVGDNLDALFVGIREFPTERIILITPPERKKDAERIIKELEKFHIPVQMHDIDGNIWEETFRAVSEIRAVEGEKDVLVNVATGDPNSRCAATSAAFVNGLKAFAVDGNEAGMLPVLKFSYYRMLTDKKMQILKLLFKKNNCCASLEDLSKETKMSLPLISYHVNGNLKSEGLKDLGLIETTETKGRVSVQLSTLGRMLIKGYVPQKEEN